MARNEHYPDKRGAGRGWAAIGTFVLAYDLFAEETLTNGFARAREHENPIIRNAALGTLAVTALHLMDAIPDDYDPIDCLNRGIQNIAGKIADWSMEGVRIP